MAGQRRQQLGEQGAAARRVCAEPVVQRAAPRRGRRAAGRDRAGRRAPRPAGRARGRCRAARAAAGAASRAAPHRLRTGRRDRAAPRSAARSSRGAPRSAASSRAPAPVTVRSTAASRLPARVPDGGDGQLQAFARRRVDHHMIARRARRPAAAGRAATRARPRRDRRAARPPRTSAARSKLAEAVERRDLEPLLQPPLGGDAVEAGAARRARRPASGSGAIDLGRAEPRQLGVERAGRRPRRARTGRSRCRRRRGRSARPTSATATSQLARARIEQRLLGQRAGGDDADDRAVDHRLGAALLRLGRAFDLLGDGDAVAGLDQPGEIGLGGVDRHAAHRDRRALMLAARGQRDVEAGRGDLGVVEEQFEEVAHPVEEQAIRRPPP